MEFHDFLFQAMRGVAVGEIQFKGTITLRDYAIQYVVGKCAERGLEKVPATEILRELKALEDKYHLGLLEEE